MSSHLPKILIVCVILLFSGVLFSCAENKDDPIIIGAVLVLTDTSGKPVLNGQDVVRGMEFAIETLNAEGGLNGRLFELKVEDCRMDPSLAREQFASLAKKKAVAVITNYSHISLGLVQMASELKVPQLAVMATAENLTKNAPYTFRYWTQSSDQAKALLPLAKKLNVKTLGLINIDNTYGNSVSDELMKRAVAEGIKVKKVVYSSINGELPGILKGLGDVDAISFTCFPSDIVALSSAIRKTYPGVDLIGPMSVASPQLFSNKSLEGIYIPAPLIYNLAKRKTNKFFVSFADKYDSPVDVYSAGGYDSIMLLFSVFERVGLSADNVTQYLGGAFTYPGLFGDVFSKQGSHHFSFPLRPARLKDGELEYFRR